MEYLIEEVTVYRVQAESEAEALTSFLADPDPDFVAIEDRHVYEAPNQPKAEGDRQGR